MIFSCIFYDSEPNLVEIKQQVAAGEYYYIFLTFKITFPVDERLTKRTIRHSPCTNSLQSIDGSVVII